MATYTIFGAGAPSGLTASGDTAELSVSTAFYVLGVTGWRVEGIRIWIPAGTSISSSGQKAYLWDGSGNTPSSIVASADFSGFTAGAWNTVLFSAPVTIVAGHYYWAQVYLPGGGYGAHTFTFGGSVTSIDTPSLYAASDSEVTTGQGSYVLGGPGQAPVTTFHQAWYGVDVLVDDGTSSGGGRGSADTVGVSDHVTIARAGLPSAIHASGAATDPLGLATTATAGLAVGSATAFHTIKRGLFDTRIAWGSVANASIAGPSFLTDPAGSLTLGLEFHVQWPVRFTGCRIYKAPNAAGTIPVRLWDLQGSGGAARELGSTTVTWVADEGGWRDITFSSPINLDANVNYTLSYYSPTSDYVASTWVFQVWDDVVTPLVVNAYQEVGASKTGASAFRLGNVQQIPDQHTASNYYIEPIVEWDSFDPVFKPDTALSYYDQWVNGRPNHPFTIAVFFADPENLQGYADIGVNTLIAGYGTAQYVEAVKAAGLDHYPFVSLYDDPQRLGLRAVQEDADYAALVRGYLVIDEPDTFAPYSPPSTIQTWCNQIRLVDSTRPLLIGMGRTVAINQTYYHQPQGSNMDVANELWRGWGALPDILYGDFYTMAPSFDPDHRWGVWTYPLFVRRLRNLNEGRTPTMVVVETTSEDDGYPVVENVRKAIWACLIEGVNGIVLFDHRFGNNTVAQDFAAMLHNPPMKAMMTDLIVRINSLVDAINSPDLGLVTATTTSNTTAGPYGGTWGVPLHYTTRADASFEYLFAMSIRPGATTGTFTIPSWAGETLTVIDEGRTVTVDGSGVLTDTFAADYTVHLYQKGASLSGAAPVVSSASFSKTLPVTTGQTVGTMSATNSPTSWAITAGDPSGYFAANSSGVISVTSAGAAGLTAGTDSLTVQATNAYGSGSGTATVTISSPSGSPGSLPTGVTLQAIDGETMTSSTTMSNNYYARNGFTYATNTSWHAGVKSWDDPTFFPIGLDYAFYPANSPTTFKTLGLNTQVRQNGGEALCLANGIWYLTDGSVFNAACMGYQMDEPTTDAMITSEITGVGSNLAGRLMGVNFTWSQYIYDGPSGGGTMQQVMNRARGGSGSGRIDIATEDIYWMAGANGPGTYAGHILYGTASDLTADQCARGSNYGDMIDANREWYTTHPAPTGVYIENTNSLVTGGLEITPPQMNWAVWSTIVHGARLVYYFGRTGTYADQFGFNPNIRSGQTISLYDQAVATNGRIADLAAIINSPFALGYVSVTPNGYTFPVSTNWTLSNGIEVMAKWYQGGTYTNTTGTFGNGFYIFACVRGSPAQTNIAATFTLNSHVTATTVTVVGEGRTIPISGNTFTDTFATAYSVHIYQVS